MHAIVPREFDYTDVDGNVTSYNSGYHNTALGTSGIAILIPPGAGGAIVSVGAGCYVGMRPTSTLASFSDANYGSILNGQPHLLMRGARGGADVYLHLATWTSTTSVAVVFV